MLDLDITLLIQLALILTLMVLLSPILFKPMLALFDLRERSIDGAKHDSQKLLDDASQKANQLQAALDDARRQALAERQKIIDSARDSERQLIDAARGEALKKIEAARGQLQKSQEAAAGKLKESNKDLARTIASKVLSREVA